MKISEKKCTKCLKTLPADKFGLMKDTYTSKRQGITTSKYYLNSRCKACARQQSREWNRNNKEHMFNKTRRWKSLKKDCIYPLWQHMLLLRRV